ncbi:hypothetical protein SARC_08915 [Sphaeroforma arctica JP610]|uniref:Xaa-Pro aminopeptidase 1 n=1 Tax=Sphaeroforma arctica JP610 TaxID=667725 RepID=A0A0L0FPD5_9EUKA|nr:hypothetical protein SARC_08915 [Sphaeroforma arctica JP610]KNC78667.1 hypothetical protein SARC_08915 [Sphaeroforma arctica JP610]|eukprot:XP_014152569.1 hypothetical protein SARC_08915 [Sphaeroforma arctica JP610]
MAATTTKLTALRSLMQKHTLAALIVPSEDAHQSEYVASAFERRAFISGFTGSAGTAVVTTSAACMWTDGRYFLQAAEEMDENWTLMRTGSKGVPTKEEWLCDSLPAKSSVGVDTSLIPYKQYRGLMKSLRRSGHTLVPLSRRNLVDEIWEDMDRPPLPKSEVFHLPDDTTGQTVAVKIQIARENMAKKKCNALVLTMLDEVAWFVNMRASDVEFNPVFYSYLLLTEESATCYVDADRMSNKAKASIANIVELKPYDAILEDIKNLPSDKKVWVSDKCSYGVASLVAKENLVVEPTPVCIAKGRKNDAEMRGAISAHVRDGAALCCYLAWLEQGGRGTEVEVATVLENYRKEQELFMGLSFPTISGAGPNGAIIHYRPEKETAAQVTDSALYLCDSGAQYLDGTTDVTRTVHLGTPTERERDCYTRVLKGHVQLAMAVFPHGTPGIMLDALARTPLWRAGLDYRHGTGHGVGAFLNVHEGPHSIAPRPASQMTQVPLEEGMLVSNEPGYYEDGAFGIRIENVVAVVKAHTEHQFGGVQYLTFKDLTMAPYQRRLIDTSLLSVEEIAHINNYHWTIYEQVSPLLNEQGKTCALMWLKEACRPL